jgi:Uma2 family endonuclease
VFHASPLLLESLRPLRRREYDCLVELGVFDDERVELLSGLLVAMSPQGPEHAEVTGYLAERLSVALAGRARVRAHSPLSLSDESEPQPDVAVVAMGDYTRSHPTRALLVIEVAEPASDSQLRKDRELKAQLYAATGIPEYWLVDLVARVVHVYRTPAVSSWPAPSAPRYADVSSLAHGSVLCPQEFPDVAIDVAEVIRGR